MNTCLFCEIANGSAPAHKVWEDENFLAFLDTNPINPGHTMMIPKQHVDTVFDLEEPLYSELFRVAKELAEPIKRAINAAGSALLSKASVCLICTFTSFQLTRWRTRLN